MNDLSKVLDHLQAIDEVLEAYLETPMHIESPGERLLRERRSLIIRHGGMAALSDAYAGAVQALYEEQKHGRSLD